MLPKGLHPPVCVLSTVCGQRVCDLFTSVLITDTDTLRFTVRVFLCCSYSGLLKNKMTPIRNEC